MRPSNFDWYADPSAHACNHHHRPKTNRRVKGTKTDPTGTGALRRRYEVQIEKRFKAVMRLVNEEIWKQDALGLNGPTTNGKYGYGPMLERMAGFEAWFQKTLHRALFGSDLDDPDFEIAPVDDFEDTIDFLAFPRGASSGTVQEIEKRLKKALENNPQSGRVRGFSASRDRMSAKFWGSAFLASAYGRGFLEAVSQVRKTGGIVSKEYIKQAMRGGRHYQTVKQLRTRQFDDMRKITDATAASVSKVLRKAMADGIGPQKAARLINDRIAKVGITRGRLLARTELISAYNESSLNLYEDAGIKGVDLQPELLTAEDDRVCSICEDAAQETYTIDDARGVIPLHPNCRCAWAPMIIDGERIRL